MANFEKAVAFTLEKEGVFSNDAADAGGKTKYGIIESELRALQAIGKFSGRRIEDLTKDEAIAIYRASYWRYEDVLSDLVATKLFDIGVNMGPGIAVRIAQYAVNFVSGADHLTVDGQWGKQTLMAINVICLVPAEALKLYKAMTLFQAKRYVDIVFANHSQLEFVSGWLARAAARP